MLYIEKEGFTPLFELVQLAERFDISIMSSKGMSVIAASRASIGRAERGINQFTTSLERKRLGLLRDMVPGADPIAVLVNPTRLVADTQLTELREAAKRLGIKLLILSAAREAEPAIHQHHHPGAPTP